MEIRIRQPVQIAVARSGEADLLGDAHQNQVDGLEAPLRQLGERQALTQQIGLNLRQGAFMQLDENRRIRGGDARHDEHGADNQPTQPTRRGIPVHR